MKPARSFETRWRNRILGKYRLAKCHCWFNDFIQAIVIGKKPGSWSFPSGHSATAFAGAWLLSRDFPDRRPFIYLLAELVAFSRIYLGDHYPGDVVSGAFSGMALPEIVRRGQWAVGHMAGSDIG